MTSTRKSLVLFALAFVAALGFLEVFGPGRPPRAHAQSQGGVIPMFGLWNQTGVVSSSNLLTTSFKPTNFVSSLRMGVTLNVTSVMYIVESNGTTTQFFAMNGGTALTAGQAYTFVWPLRQYDNNDPTSGKLLSYNFQLATSPNNLIPVLRGDEVTGAVD